jgi:hypothetical protein
MQKTILNFCNKAFKLVKYNPKSESDYTIFKNIMIDNIEYTTLQNAIPGLNKIDLQDKKAVKLFFTNQQNNEVLQSIYTKLFEKQQDAKIGYNKIYNTSDNIVGNVGWIIEKVNNNQIDQVQRGIHLTKQNCTDNIQKGIGCIAMRLALEELTDNQDTLNPDGKIVSKILTNNTRSQKFTQKHKLNFAEPKIENNIITYEHNTKDFLAKADSMKQSLDKEIVTKFM